MGKFGLLRPAHERVRRQTRETGSIKAHPKPLPEKDREMKHELRRALPCNFQTSSFLNPMHGSSSRSRYGATNTSTVRSDCLAKRIPHAALGAPKSHQNPDITKKATVAWYSPVSARLERKEKTYGFLLIQANSPNTATGAYVGHLPASLSHTFSELFRRKSQSDRQVEAPLNRRGCGRLSSANTPGVRPVYSGLFGRG